MISIIWLTLLLHSVRSPLREERNLKFDPTALGKALGMNYIIHVVESLIRNKYLYAWTLPSRTAESELTLNDMQAPGSLCPGYKHVEAFVTDDIYESEEEVSYITLDLGDVEPQLVPSSTTYRLIVRFYCNFIDR